MKKLLCFLCTLLLLTSMSVTAFATETVFQAEIPDTHTITVKSEGGRVALDGVVCKGTAEVERHKEQSYRIIPDAGKLIDKVLYNGEDVTGQLKKGVFTAPKLVRDAELSVTYKDAPPAPDAREYDVSGKVEDTEGNPLPGVTVEIGGKADVTDENGKFNIEDLPSGIHQIVITDEDGNIIGSGQITIEKSAETNLTLTVDENGNPVITPGQDTENIDITLVIDNDGMISVTGAKDTTPPKPDNLKDSGNSPRAGDSSHIWFWFILLILSCTGLIGMMIYNKKKRKERR